MSLLSELSIPAKTSDVTSLLTKCIYCGSTDERQSIAHIVPESLGGKCSPVLAPGVVCHKCNQYFGQKVEAKALASFPFLQCRALSAVPTKKGRQAFFGTSLGKVTSGGSPGLIDIIPRSKEVDEKIQSGEISAFVSLAQVTEPLSVCQMLLKIGIEFLAKHQYDLAISDRFADARSFARSPRRGDSWWATIRCDPALLFSFTDTQNELEILEYQAIPLFVLRMSGVQAMVPLERCRLESELSEPEFMVVRAVC